MQTDPRHTRRSLAHARRRNRTATFALTAGLVALTALGAAAPAVAASLAGTTATGLAPTLASLNDDAQNAAHAASLALNAADAASSAVADSGLNVDAAVSPTATAELEAAVDKLHPLDLTPALFVPSLVEDVTDATERVAAQTDTVTAALAEAEAVRAAEIAAAAAAAEAARVKAAAEAAAAALAAANTPDGAKATARSLAAAEYGWGDDQFSCLESLWTKESGWNLEAYNPSGATGIPQALPGDKMASAGADWQTNATTQITWGLGYIDDVYGSPCAAWGHSQANNWY